jgi:tryptophanyl-tRNA synthetase
LGFYTYPILQAADIAIMNGEVVPIGEDQLTHLELAREIIRKANRTYHTTFAEPLPRLAKTSKLIGLDGRKMSSSQDNSIGILNETEKTIESKVKKIKTDDQRLGIHSPGNPENCHIYSFQKVFQSENHLRDIDQGCRQAQLGCGDCKKKLTQSLCQFILPVREKSLMYSKNELDDILQDGKQRACQVAKTHWEHIREKIEF